MHSLLPDLQNSTVLDIGCGFGKNYSHYATLGARYVLGIDISSKMIELANNTNLSDGIQYNNIALEDARCEPDFFDLVTSSLAGG